MSWLDGMTGCQEHCNLAGAKMSMSNFKLDNLDKPLRCTSAKPLLARSLLLEFPYPLASLGVWTTPSTGATKTPVSNPAIARAWITPSAPPCAALNNLQCSNEKILHLYKSF